MCALYHTKILGFERTLMKNKSEQVYHKSSVREAEKANWHDLYGSSIGLAIASTMDNPKGSLREGYMKIRLLLISSGTFAVSTTP